MKTTCQQCQTDLFDDNDMSYPADKTVCAQCEADATKNFVMYRNDEDKDLLLSQVETEFENYLAASHKQDNNSVEAEFDDMEILNLPLLEVNTGKNYETSNFDNILSEAVFDSTVYNAQSVVDEKTFEKSLLDISSNSPVSLNSLPAVSTQVPLTSEADSIIVQEKNLTDSQPGLVLPSQERERFGLKNGIVSVPLKYLGVCIFVFVSLIVLSGFLNNPIAQSGTAVSEVVNEPAVTVKSEVAESVPTEQASNLNSGAELIAKSEAAPEPTPVLAPVLTAPVTEATPEATPEAQPVQEPLMPQITTPNNGRFTIQVGAYNSVGEANQRAADLESKGFKASIVEVEIPKRGIWHRVQVGRFGSRNEATQFSKELKARRAAESIIITEK